MTWLYTLCVVLGTAYMVTVVSLVVLIISENRNPIRTMLWVIVLMFLPMIGLVFYYFFGEDRRRKRFISKRMYKRLKYRPLTTHLLAEEGSSAVPITHHQLTRLLKNLDRSPILDGNEVQFFTSASAKYEALLADMERATHHIHMQYYIFEEGEVANRIRNVLICKAKEGVEVRFLYDEVASWTTGKQFFRSMREAGVLISPFLNVKFPLLTSRVNYRNHRKIVVIDGEVGYMGGMNVADRYLNGGTRFSQWKDIHVRIRGKGVQGLQSSFLLDWYYSYKTYLTSHAYFPSLPTFGGNPMQVVVAGPVGLYRSIAQGLLYAFSNAKSCIYIQTPYFIPSASLLSLLQTVSMSGIDVKIMIPRATDAWVVRAASCSFIEELLDYRIEVYFYEKGFLHSKLVVVDDELTIVGSSNMDVRSFEHNFEVNAFIYGEETNQKAKRIFLDDLKNSSLVSAESWKNRSRSLRFKESACRLLAPLL